MTGARIVLKAENIQRAGSFKVRGSVNKLRKLVAEGDVREVTAASAGNHAQGVAYAASRLGIASTIFMPQDAPLAKRRATEELGGDVRIVGANYDEARAAALEHAHAKDAAFIDGFDDWDVIEGQGTVGVELARALGDQAPDLALVPVGGGGLLAGIAFYLKAVYGDSTKVIGIQSDRAIAMAESFRLARGGGEGGEGGEGGPEAEELPLLVPTRPTIADGIRIGRPGSRPFEIIRRVVDDVICVGEEAIYQAIVHLYERSRLVVEGAGAVGVAALLEQKIELAPDSTAVIVISGGNVDLGAMQKIIKSFLHKSQRRAVLRIRVKDAPGQLARVVRVFEREKVNVSEIMQPPILAKPISPEYTVFDMVVETEGARHLPHLLEALADEQEEMRREGYEPFEILDR